MILESRLLIPHFKYITFSRVLLPLYDYNDMTVVIDPYMAAEVISMQTLAAEVISMQNIIIIIIINNLYSAY